MVLKIKDSFRVEFIGQLDFHYTPGVIEGVESFPEERFYYGENWEQGSFVRVTFGDHMRDCICRTTYWSQDDYKKHWVEQFKRVEDGASEAVFVVNITICDDDTAADLNRWYCLRKKDEGGYALFYDEYWNVDWREEYNEEPTPENFAKRCAQRIEEELMLFEADLEENGWILFEEKDGAAERT